MSKIMSKKNKKCLTSVFPLIADSEVAKPANTCCYTRNRNEQTLPYVYTREIKRGNEMKKIRKEKKGDSWEIVSWVITIIAFVVSVISFITVLIIKF